ncbi:MAG: response regulator [Candidatus Binataceae bacterium]
METSLKAGSAGKKILIVDDELGILEVLEFILGDAGFSVKTALNGQEALARLDELVPDLVILDYMMPILDGQGMIDAMHANAKYSKIPIILTSALHEATIRKRCSGYQAFLRKPYKAEHLIEEISRILDHTKT